MDEGARLRLGDWLAPALEADRVAVDAVARLGGGAIQQTWLVELGVEGGPSEGALAVVLRTDAPSGVAFSLSRAQEFQVLQAAFAAGVTVPEPLALCTDAAVIGRPFAILAKAEGTVDPRRLVRDDGLVPDREALGRAIGRELALIHRIRPQPGRLDTLPPPPAGHPAAARIAELRDHLDRLPDPQPALDWGLRRLERLLPAPAAVVLRHGDFRTGNIMVERNRVTAVLDWEFAGWGDPHEDLGWFCARCWRFGADRREGGGLTSRDAVYRGYETAAGVAIDLAAVPWWEVLATIRWAIIALQQGLRHRAEADPALEPALTGRLAPQLAWDMLDQLDRLGGRG